MTSQEEKGFVENKIPSNETGEMERELEREWLVDDLRAEGIRDEKVLKSIRIVPRHNFVTAEQAPYAYYDEALEIGQGQTISQPYIVALMLETLQINLKDRVLEIGTGSGYAAAVLCQLAEHVYTIERHEALANEARARFKNLNYPNISVRVGDGTKGWPEESPFNGIIVAAAGPTIPTSLKMQLAVGGRLVIPIGDKGHQNLVRVIRISEKDYKEEVICRVRFVPLIGEEGWGAKI